jgi:hypothetical protein
MKLLLFILAVLGLMWVFHTYTALALYWLMIGSFAFLVIGVLFLFYDIFIA